MIFYFFCCSPMTSIEILSLGQMRVSWRGPTSHCSEAYCVTYLLLSLLGCRLQRRKLWKIRAQSPVLEGTPWLWQESDSEIFPSSVCSHQSNHSLSSAAGKLLSPAYHYRLRARENEKQSCPRRQSNHGNNWENNMFESLQLIVHQYSGSKVLKCQNNSQFWFWI